MPVALGPGTVLGRECPDAPLTAPSSSDGDDGDKSFETGEVVGIPGDERQILGEGC